MPGTDTLQRDSDAAKLLLDLANQKHDGIWKRRQITWRTNFVLWAALLAVAAVLYREAGSLPPGSLWAIVIAFGVVFLAHAWHWIGAFVSDQIGFSWMHYYEQQAQLRLGVTIPENEIRERPSEDQSWKYHLLHKRPWTKAHAVIAQIVVTAALMLLALTFVCSKAATDSHAGAAAMTEDRLSGENLHAVLEKLPSATPLSKP